jgi:hypothetical protein
MPAGMKYDLNPLEVEKELWNQSTTFRLSGGFNLDDDKLAAGITLPSLTPLAIDFATRKAKAVKNVKIYENAAANAVVIKIKKNSLAYVNMYLGNGVKAALVTAIDKTNAAYDVLTITLGAAVTDNQILFETTAVVGVKGVYTLTIGTVPAVDDKLTINGTEYTFAAAAAEGKIMIGADKVATTGNLQDTVEADNQDFVVKANGAKLVLTQKVAGTGAIPVIVVTQTGGGTLAATIAQTTAGVSGTSTEPLNVAKFLNYASVKVETGATVTAIGQAYEIKESKLTVPVSAKDKVSLGARFMFV